MSSAKYNSKAKKDMYKAKKVTYRKKMNKLNK